MVYLKTFSKMKFRLSKVYFILYFNHQKLKANIKSINQIYQSNQINQSKQSNKPIDQINQINRSINSLPPWGGVVLSY